MYNNYDYSPAEPLKEGEDFYMAKEGYRIMTEKFLTQKGYCCGNGCKHCPYYPSHKKGNRNLR
ncbi:DUF5522 domain-containing protein [bacterium]|nr:DUF5522 domain-containing protein [bacterium]